MADSRHTQELTARQDGSIPPRREFEKLGTTESTTLSVSRETGGKIRVTSLLWPEAKVILKDEVLELRNVDGRLCVAEAPAPRRLGPPVES
jgi:hypothetical protein